MTANRPERTPCCPFTPFFAPDHVKPTGLTFSTDHISVPHSGGENVSRLPTIILMDGPLQVKRSRDCTDHYRLYPKSLCIWKPGNRQRAVHYAMPLYNNCCGCRKLTGIMLGQPQITAGTRAEKRVLSSSHKLIYSTCYLFI